MVKLTLSGWNDLLTQINTLAVDPPGGCAALSTLPLVVAPHKWSVDDVNNARAKLLAICDSNSFVAPTVKWTQAIIDELTVAIGVGWCGCGAGCNATIDYEMTLDFDSESCTPPSFSPDEDRPGLDWVSICSITFDIDAEVDGMTVYPPLSPAEYPAYGKARYWLLIEDRGGSDPHPSDPSITFPRERYCGVIDEDGLAIAPSSSIGIATRVSYSATEEDLSYTDLSPSLELHAKCVAGQISPSVKTAGTYTNGQVIGTVSLTADGDEDDGWYFDHSSVSGSVGIFMEIDDETGVVTITGGPVDLSPQTIDLTIRIRRDNPGSVTDLERIMFLSVTFV